MSDASDDNANAILLHTLLNIFHANNNDNRFELRYFYSIAFTFVPLIAHVRAHPNIMGHACHAIADWTNLKAFWYDIRRTRRSSSIVHLKTLILMYLPLSKVGFRPFWLGFDV